MFEYLWDLLLDVIKEAYYDEYMLHKDPCNYWWNELGGEKIAAQIADLNRTYNNAVQSSVRALNAVGKSCSCSKEGGCKCQEKKDSIVEEAKLDWADYERKYNALMNSLLNNFRSWANGQIDFIESGKRRDAEKLWLEARAAAVEKLVWEKNTLISEAQQQYGI